MKILHIITNDAEIQNFEKISNLMDNNFIHYYHNIADKEVKIDEFDIIHAHSWFSGASFALEKSKKSNKPFIVSLQQSDIKHFRKTIFYKKNQYSSLLSEAAKVVFTNNSQQNQLANLLQGQIADQIFEHATTLMEPVDDFWIQNIRIHPPTGLVNIKLLYVGEFVEDSKLDIIWKAVKKLVSNNYSVNLTAVETNRVDCNFRNKIAKIAEKSDNFTLKNFISQENMLEIYRNHDIMVLLNENDNSIVHYAEALTQGLPIIYANDGIFDGILNNKFTKFNIEPHKTDDLSKKILEISNLFASVEQHICDLHPFLMFDARETSRKYEHLYDNVAIL